MDKKGSYFYSGYSGLTYTDITNFLGKSFTVQEQTIATSLISSIELFLARKCNRNFLHNLSSNSYYELFDASREKYYFFNFPIKEIVKIELDSVIKYDKSNEAGSEYKRNSDFFVYDTSIVCETVLHSSTNDRRAVKIFYTIDQFWGDDLTFAIKQWVAEIFSQREYGSKHVTSFSVTGLSINFSEKELPEYLKQIISVYKKVLL